MDPMTELLKSALNYSPTGINQADTETERALVRRCVAEGWLKEIHFEDTGEIWFELTIAGRKYLQVLGYHV